MDSQICFQLIVHSFAEEHEKKTLRSFYIVLVGSLNHCSFSASENIL